MPGGALVRRYKRLKINHFMTTPEKLTCNQVSVLVSQAQDRNLGPVEQLRLQAHMAICEACRNFQRQMDFLRRAFRGHPAGRDEEDKPE